MAVFPSRWGMCPAGLHAWGAAGSPDVSSPSESHAASSPSVRTVVPYRRNSRATMDTNTGSQRSAAQNDGKAVFDEINQRRRSIGGISNVRVLVQLHFRSLHMTALFDTFLIPRTHDHIGHHR